MKRELLTMVEGLFAHSVDFALWITVYIADMGIPQSSTGQILRAQIAADEFLNQCNYGLIKNALQTARKNGWIVIKKRRAMPQITKEGLQRLKRFIPQYDQLRSWDGRMHLVTYDIPEIYRGDRKKLRVYLKQLGCGMLQESVWITPYNPIDLLRKVIVEKKLSGNIIVSDMGKDGSIGEEDLRAMLVRIYRLDEINERYKSWLNHFKIGSHQTILYYLAILKDDPQLPFSLLPMWWKGDEAYRKIQPYMKQVVFSGSTGPKITT